MTGSNQSRALEATKDGKFGAWFKLQFGRLPNASRLTKLRNRRQELEAQLAEATMEFRMEDSLHAAWRAALYGWNARKR